MNRFTLYILMAVSALLSAGCSQETIPLPPEGDDSGDGLILTVGVAMPEIATATRGIPGDKPGAGLKLTLLEFSRGTDAASSFLTHVYEAETLTPTAVENNGIVKFKVTLAKTQEPKVLHLIVSDEFVSTGYGSEASLLPAISVGRRNNAPQEAYWGRVEFPNGYATAADADGNQALLPEVKTKLTEVPVIRNFARVTVTVENTADLELYGFELVNVPTSGTVAPFNTETSRIPQLLAADGKTMVSYDEAHAGYTGILPSGITFANTEDVAKKWDTEEDIDKPLNSSRPRYIYEHPFESTRRTYLIIKGIYNNSGNPTYYKADLGNIGEDHVFKFYDLIRNYSYNVRITGVHTAGAATVADAINGHVSNNLSASVETSSMLQISDGQNMLMVNATSHIITSERQKVEVRYKYITNVASADKPVDNSAVTVIGKNTSNDVIAAYTESDDGEWHVINITPKAPDILDKRHTLRISDGNGLEREVSLLLRQPYEFASTADVYEGEANNRPSDKTKGAVSRRAGQPLVVYFDLPDGIPESVFPMQFRLEADRQNVENNPKGSLVVWTGPSLFDGKPTISYIKTVTYAEYCYKYKTDTSTELDVNSYNTGHSIRCLLRTINADTSDGSETTTIKIYNPAFNRSAEATFNRTLQ